MSDSEPSPIAGAYDRWAATYDDCANATRDLDARVLRESGPDVAGRDVVEVGCGTGKNTEWLVRRARSVLALDFSEGMLEEARRRVPADAPVRFVRQDVRLPWPADDGGSDVVLIDLVLEHVGEVGAVFGEAARVLRPGGRLFVCELHPYRQWRGGQAHFEDSATGETVRVPVCIHSVAEFVNEGLAAGLRLEALGEWLEDGAPAGAPPRLLSLLFRKP